MKKILSLLMALVLATGVCLCISSCEEAEDTSSPMSENEASNEGPTGRDIILNSAAKDIWNDLIVTEKYPPKCVATGIDGSGGEPQEGTALFNVYLYDSEIKDIILFAEEHITGEIEPRSEWDEHKFFDLLNYVLEDGSDSVYFGADRIMIQFNFCKDNVLVLVIGGGDYAKDPEHPSITVTFQLDECYDEISAKLLKKFNRPVTCVPHSYF